MFIQPKSASLIRYAELLQPTQLPQAGWYMGAADQSQPPQAAQLAQAVKAAWKDVAVGQGELAQIGKRGDLRARIGVELLGK